MSRDSVIAEYYFPHYGTKSDKPLIDIFNSAEYSIDIAIFAFTDEKILNALLNAKNRGVSVRMITDRKMALTPLQHRYLKRLENDGVLIKKNTHPGFMHLKMTITDSSIVSFASANFTKSSQIKNDEAMIVLRGGRAAAEFETQFDLMWREVTDFREF